MKKMRKKKMKKDIRAKVQAAKLNELIKKL
jgi:hypothetical protein